MISRVYWQRIGRLVAQANQLGPEVGSHLALCCIHRMNWVNSHSALSIMMAP